MFPGARRAPTRRVRSLSDTASDEQLIEPLEPLGQALGRGDPEIADLAGMHAEEPGDLRLGQIGVIVQVEDRPLVAGQVLDLAVELGQQGEPAGVE